MGSKKIFLYLLPVFIAWSLVFWPQFWVYTAMLIDFYTPWVLFDSPLYRSYHDFIVGRLEERPEIPLPEIPIEKATYEEVLRVTKDFTYPVIIRGMLAESPAMQLWSNKTWWTEKYGSETVLCGTLSTLKAGCTIQNFFDELKDGNPYYISGASKIFIRNPELHDMVDSEQIRSIEPGHRTATQIFMGTSDMGSDIHCATGINVFRQVVGRKKWWFLPPSQTAYLIPAININGFSCHTHTMVGKGSQEVSPWLNKLERYTAILEPGDVLINPPWFWHGIKNLGEDPIANNNLIVGVPSRYSKGTGTKAAFRSNKLLSSVMTLTLLNRYGYKNLVDPTFNINLEDDIAENRADRKGNE